MKYICIFLFLCTGYLYPQGILKLEDILDPAKKTQWKVFDRKNNTVIEGDAATTPGLYNFVNYDNDRTNIEVELTNAEEYRMKSIWHGVPVNLNICSSWSVEFELRTWGSKSVAPGDGFSFAFVKNPNSTQLQNVMGPGALGIPKETNGFVVVYDTWPHKVSNRNRVPIIEIQEITIKENYTETTVPATGIGSVPGGRGVAIGQPSHSVLRKDDYTKWRINYQNGIIRVSYFVKWWSGGPTVEYPLTMHKVTQDYSYPGFLCFSAATGMYNDQVSIKDLKITFTPSDTLKNKAKYVYICKDSPVDLDGGDGYDSYQWKKLGSNNIIGTDRLLKNINTVGVYTVLKGSACRIDIDTIKIEKFGTIANNPLESQMDTIIYDPSSGEKVMELYLCGNNSRKITINNNGVHEIRWFRDNTRVHTGNTLNVDSAGSYRVEIEFRATDGSSCMSEYSFVAYKSNLNPKASLELSNCNNGKENKVTITDAPNCEFSLDGITYQDSSNIINLGNENKNFTIYVKDKVGGCIYPITNIITSEYRDLGLNITANHQKCTDINDGNIGIKIDGGRLPYNIYKKIGNGSFTLEYSSKNVDSVNISVPNINSLSDKYVFKIVDNEGCEIINSVEIRKPEPLNFDVEIINNSCNQMDDGKIIIKNTRGGTQGYEYSKDNGKSYQKDTIFSDLLGGLVGGLGTEGKYTIIVRDINGCLTPPMDVFIVKPELDTISYITTKLDCHNGNNASIQILYPIGNSYKYSIDNTNYKSSNIFDSLTFGTFTVYAKDTSKPNGCIINKDIIIDNPEEVIAKISVSKKLTCKDLQEDIEVNVTGGTPPYSFSFDGGYQYILDNTYSYKHPGDYNIFVKDALGCMADTLKIDIDNPSIISAQLHLPDSGTCPGDMENLIVDNAKALEVNGNISSVPIDSIKIFKLPATSNSDLIAESHGNKIDKFNLNNTTEVRVVIYGNGGCTYSIDTIIKPKKSPYSINKKRDISCKGEKDGQLVINYGDIDSLLKFPIKIKVENLTDSNLSPSGIITFQSKKDTIIDNLSAGQYKVTITDYIGCESVFLGREIILIEPSEDLAIDYVNTINPKSCYDNGIIEVGAKGGWGEYRYRLININPVKNDTIHFQESKIFPKLKEGDYLAEVTDLKGCIKQVLNQPNVILKREDKFSTTKDSTDVKCYNNNDGTITIEAKNIKSPVSYKIEGPISIDYVSVSDITYTYNKLSPGKYYVYVKDYYGCEKKDSVVISEPTELILDSLEYIKKVVCQGDKLKVKIRAHGGSPKGGIYEYGMKKDLGTISWQGNNDIFEVSDSAKYTFYVRDSNMCEKYIEYHFNPPTELILEDIIETSKIFCLGGSSASVMLSNVYGGISPYKTRLYKDGSLVDPTYINNKYNYDSLGAGKYKIEVEDALGCTKQSKEIEFKDPPLFVLDGIKTTDLSCYGGLEGRLGTITSYVSGGTPPYQYNIGTQKWSDDNLISYLKAGIYTLTARDANGCVVDRSKIEIKEPLELKLNIDYISNVSCKGGSDGVVYYSVEGGTPPYTVKFESYLPPFSYSTNLNSNDSTNKIRDTIKNLKSTSYGIFTLIDASGCKLIEDIKVLEPEELKVGISSSYNCETLEYTISLKGSTGGTPPYTFKVVNNDDNSIVNLIGNGDTFTCFEGDFNIEMTDKNGCKDVVSNFERIKYPKLQILTETDMVGGHIKFLTVGGRPNIVIKSYGESSIIKEGMYKISWNKKDTVLVYDNRRDNDIDKNQDIYDFSYCLEKKNIESILPFEFPNFFTPDGDGINDIYEIIYIGDNNLSNDEKRYIFKKEFPEAIINIYNKKGLLLYTFRGVENGWDGTVNGIQMPSDDYWASVIFSNGEIMKGAFRLIRK